MNQPVRSHTVPWWLEEEIDVDSGHRRLFIVYGCTGCPWRLGSLQDHRAALIEMRQLARRHQDTGAFVAPERWVQRLGV